MPTFFDRYEILKNVFDNNNLKKNFFKLVHSSLELGLSEQASFLMLSM